jgi:hypothetical protein
MEVPVYRDGVPVEDVQLPNARLNPLPPSASGANIGEAVAGLGKTVEHVSSQIGQQIIYMQRQESAVKAEQIKSDAIVRAQDLHASLASKTGADAIGIVSGPLNGGVGPMRPEQTEKQKQSWDAQWQQIKADALKEAQSQGLGVHDIKLLERQLDTHGNSYRGSLIAYEAKQRKVAADDADNAAHQTAVLSASVAARQQDYDALVEQGKQHAVAIAARNGHDMSDPDQRKVIEQASADEFAKAYVHANNDQATEKVAAFLKTNAGGISPVVHAQLQQVNDGKMVDLRSQHIFDQISEEPESRDKINGMFNLSYVERRAKEISATRPEHEQLHYQAFARQQAQMADAALAQQKTQASRDILDEFSKARDGNVIFSEADKKIMGQYLGEKKLFTPSEIDRIRSSAAEVYKRSESGIDARLAIMTDDQKTAYADVVNRINTTFKTQTATIPGEDGKVKVSDALVKRFKQIAPTMQPAQMREWIEQQTKGVQTKPAFVNVLGHDFGTGKTPLWMEQTKLRSQYGDENVRKASRRASEARPSAGLVLRGPGDSAQSR